MCWPDGSSPTTESGELVVDSPVIGAPIRSWHGANRRLSPHLNAPARRDLAMALADRTARTAAGAGGSLLIVSSDPEVATWAAEGGRRVIPEAEGGGLNGAARAVTAFAEDRGLPWLILHSDLPCLTEEEVSEAIRAVRSGRRAVAPSYNGGTSALGGRGPYPFSYGPGSFHRHLRTGPPPVTLISLGFLLDIDTPADLNAARRHPRGNWLNQTLQSSGRDLGKGEAGGSGNKTVGPAGLEPATNGL